MSHYDYDLFVIGAGSGGVRAARMSGDAGARVAIAEARHFGGTCVNIGCVPKKLFTYAAAYGDVVKDARGYGWEFSTPHFDWAKLITNKDNEIGRLNGIYERLLTSAGVDIFWGYAKVVDQHRIQVNGQTKTAERILIATGNKPVRLNIPGAELGLISDDLFSLKALPKKIMIIGGGYIAVEFAGIFNGLGVEVTQASRSHRLLKGFDAEVAQHLAEEMAKKGIAVYFDARPTRLQKTAHGITCILENEKQIEADAVLFATGRRPNTENLGLETVGVTLSKNGAVIVDEGFRSSVPSIWAIGDVIDRLQLTPVALAEAMALYRHWFKGGSATLDYQFIPTAVFSTPNVGTVGLTEEVARTRYPQIDVYRSIFKPMKHTMTGRDEKTLMKLIVDRTTDKIVGLHMVGPDAGEIVQGFAVALKAGATKAVFDATIGIHPTAAEEFVTMRELAPVAG
ncbi:MAG: glutathione-disulfide reductase [Alphaproteobacteria bacterium]